MAISKTSNDHQFNPEEEKLSQECKNLLLSLPKEEGMVPSAHIYLYKGFWCLPSQIHAITAFYNEFRVRNNDVIVASGPKSGTTWLKALTFAIMRRGIHAPSQKDHPLLTSNSHVLVPFVEFELNPLVHDRDRYDSPEPGLFGTHIPFDSLPDSVKQSPCKMVYICRNPYDACVSFWQFAKTFTPPSLPFLSLEEAFDRYCKGTIVYGAFWTHMLGYWNESKKRPDKVLFLKYEDLKEDIEGELKKIAQFLGCPFSYEEESRGVIEDIVGLCSFEKMKELEVNKNGVVMVNYQNKNFFRKGEIGDYVNHLTPSMIERLSKIVEEKLGGSGLSFKVPLLSPSSQ